MNKQCHTTTLPCIKECKEGECALHFPFGDPQVEDSLSGELRGFLYWLSANDIYIDGGWYYTNAFTAEAKGHTSEEIITLYIKHKRNSR